MKYFKYLKYLFKHKYYVFKFGLKLKVPIFRLLIHDWSKFLSSELIPYVNYFYGNYESEKEAIIYTYQRAFGVPYPKELTKEFWKKKFDYAWNLHQKRNKHHYQFWILTEDSGKQIYLDMPDKYIKEMVADWASAGFCITGKLKIKDWYHKNKERILISDNTRTQVEYLINKF